MSDKPKDTAAAEVGRDPDVVLEGTKEGMDLFRKIERNHAIERCARVAKASIIKNWGICPVPSALADAVDADILALKDKP